MLKQLYYIFLNIITSKSLLRFFSWNGRACHSLTGFFVCIYTEQHTVNNVNHRYSINVKCFVPGNAVVIVWIPPNITVQPKIFLKIFFQEYPRLVKLLILLCPTCSGIKMAYFYLVKNRAYLNWSLIDWNWATDVFIIVWSEV